MECENQKRLCCELENQLKDTQTTLQQHQNNSKMTICSLQARVEEQAGQKVIMQKILLLHLTENSEVFFS